MRSVLLVAMLPSACAPEFEETVIDRGRLCVYASPDPIPDDLQDYAQLLSADVPYVVGKPAAVAVHFAISGCTNDYEAECSVEAETASDFVVHSRASWSPHDGGCTREYRIASAICLTPPLQAQSYSIRFGDRRGSFEAPGSPGECLQP